MGNVAEGLINGEFDFHTGEYLGNPVGYPRSTVNPRNKAKYKYFKETEVEKKIREIRKEIAINISGGMTINEARKEANIKYGKGWRTKGLITE